MVRETVVELLKHLIEIKSVNDPVRGVKPGKDTALFIHDLLVDWGFSPEVIESNGYYSVFECTGSGKPVLLLMAHYDTVPVDPEKWNHDPFKLTIVGNKGYGRGALDDKSNVAALLVLLKRLGEEGFSGNICYAFTGDEEVGGFNGARVIAEKLASENILPKYMVNADGVGMKVIVRRRKVFNILVKTASMKKKVKGRIRRKTFKASYPLEQHSHAAYFIPGLDTHPLIAASTYVRENNVCVRSIKGVFIKSNVVPPKATVEYVDEDPHGREIVCDEGLTYLLKALLPLTRMPIPEEKPSDYGVNITPNMYLFDRGKHVIQLDVRVMSNSVESIVRELERIKEIYPLIEYDVRGGQGGYLYTSLDSILVKTFFKTLESFGVKPEAIEGAGASDSRYFTPHGVEAVDFGPQGGNIHGDNEYVLLDSLKILPDIYYSIVKTICNSRL